MNVSQRPNQYETTYERIVACFRRRSICFQEILHTPEGQTHKASEIRGHTVDIAAKSMVVEVRPSTSNFTGNNTDVSTYVLAVVPGDRLIDLKGIKKAFGGKKANFAAPGTAMQLTQCEMGSVPPISFDLRLAVVFDTYLLKKAYLVFNAGKLDASFKVSSASLLSLGQSTVAPISKAAKSNAGMGPSHDT